MVDGLLLRYFNKGALLVAALLLCLAMLPGNVCSQERNAIRTVVIDAGHGGKDPGAVGRRAQEKNIVLTIALKLGTLIQRNFPEVKVIYTRDRDQLVELHERASIANRNHADLFISIHANANNVKTLRGAETYIMGLHRSQANLEIAKLENASILLESDYTANYEGFDPNSDESYITFSLYQNANLDLSSRFAAVVQEQMKERVGLNDRGVRQAGFLVLYKTTMPSVLVEVGYMSNPDEENFLISGQGQDYIASAIYRAFREYKQQIEQGGSAGFSKDQQVKNQQDNHTDAQILPQKSDVVFKVQLAATPDEIPVTSPRFRGLKGVEMYKHNGMFKYTYGNEVTFEQALELQSRMKTKGFTDSFIVAFRNGVRISVDEARGLKNP